MIRAKLRIVVAVVPGMNVVALPYFLLHSTRQRGWQGEVLNDGLR